jgi:glycosyltransferase involved in cell wall biosynthesis
VPVANGPRMTTASQRASFSADLYLDLMERCLTNSIYGDGYTDWEAPAVERPYDVSLRDLGRDWPRQAHTMVGRARLRNLRQCVEKAIAEGVPGDLIETGAWRGGACILMRAVLEAYEDRTRLVFVADSFEGLPAPNADAYPQDQGDRHHTFEELSVSLDEVKANFAKYGLLDDRVVFLKGWFKDTLPRAPIERLAVLRLDGDMYESTMDALTALYDKVSPGGFVIIDDYGCIEACRKAVHDFREARGISEPILDIDGWGVYWRKEKETGAGVSEPVALAAPVGGESPRPFWSVIVPLYNRTAYLKQCIDSVLDQDPGPEEMEILVVDDASPGDLGAFVHDISRGRVRYIRNSTNLGLYPSTNAAIQAARGRFLHILHDDDWVENGFYAKMRGLVEGGRGEADVAFCMYGVSYEGSGKTWSPPPFRAVSGPLGRDFLTRLALDCPLNLPAVVFRRETFERVGLFRTDLPMMADWEWYVRSAVQCAWRHEPERLAWYRFEHARQLTTSLVESFVAYRDFRKVMEIFERILPKNVAAATLPAARSQRARSYLAAAAKCLENGRADLADRNVWEALDLDEGASASPEFAELARRPDYPRLRAEIRRAALRAFRLTDRAIGTDPR